MSSTSCNKIIYNFILVGACAILCIAIIAKAQYNTFDSDSNADSDGNPILTQAELGKLVRNSGRLSGHQQNRAHQQHAAATRNLYNRQQPLQYAPSHNNKRNYGSPSMESLNGYGPMGAASSGRHSNQNSDADDDDSPSFGPNFGSNFDNSNDGENEGSQANNGDGPAMNLNQAASGYPSHGDYNSDAGANAGFGFGGSSGYGPSVDGSEFGPSDGFVGDGRRAKSASSLMGSRGYGSEDDAGAPQYGPNSAVNGDNDEDSRAGYAPEGQNDNENDDE